MCLAVYFPDETAFYSGMGIDLYENYPEIQKTFKKLNKFAGYNLKKIVYGSDKELSENQKRIAVVVMSVSIFREWQKTSGIVPDYMCGKGIGYISAMVCTGELSLWYAVWRLRTGKMKLPSSVKMSENVYNTEEGDVDLIKDCDVLLDVGPANTYKTAIMKNVKPGVQRKVYFDNPNDSSFLLDTIKRKKFLNYFYAARRLSGIAAATQNHTNNSEDNMQLDSAYMELMNKIDAAARNVYQNNIDFTKDGFRECAEALKTILHIKNVKHEEVSGQFAEIQSETGIDMCEYFEEWV